jgi:hypothetical protein
MINYKVIISLINSLIMENEINKIIMKLKLNIF